MGRFFWLLCLQKSASLSFSATNSSSAEDACTNEAIEMCLRNQNMIMSQNSRLQRSHSPHRWTLRKPPSNLATCKPRIRLRKPAVFAAFSIPTCFAIRQLYPFIAYVKMPCISCKAPLSDRDRHVICALCALCLGPDHAANALSLGGCKLCEELPMSTLRARLALFDAPAVFPSASAGPRKKKRRSQRPPEPAAVAERSPEPLPRASLSPSPPLLPDAQRPAFARTAVASEDEADHAAIADSCSILASDSEEWSGSHRSSSSAIVERFSEVQKASQAMNLFLPRRSSSSAGRSQQPPARSSSQRSAQPPSSQRRQGGRPRSRSASRHIPPPPRGPRSKVPHPAQRGDPNPETIRPLAMRAKAWQAIQGVSEWVLNTIMHGYSLQFARRPPRFLARTETRVSKAEIAKLLHKGAIEQVHPSLSESGFYSRYFLVPKKDGALRPILDLRHLNKALMRRPFKMITTRHILAQIRPGDWFISLDLKDAYFQIQITPRHRPFLRFAFDGRAYQYTVLPFGLSLAPRTFTKCMDAALSPLRR
ncbi:hypothetical protein PO909_005166 [Leuciscus waleckii]